MPRDSLGTTTDGIRDLDGRRIRTALALGHVEDALRSIDAMSAGRRRDVELRATRAELLLASGRPDQAEELAARALRRVVCPELSARLRIVRAVARWEVGGRVSRSSLEGIGSAPLSRPVRAASYEALARMQRHRLEFGSAESALREALALHVTDESTEGVARVLGARADLERERGRTLEALRLQERSVELSRATTRLDLQASAHCSHGELLVSVGSWRQAGTAVERGRSLSHLVGGSRFATRSVRGSALVALAQGDLEAARLSIDAARDASTGPRGLAEASLAASDLALAIGDAVGALTAAEEAIRLCRGVSDEAGVRRAWVRKAQALIALGRHEGALECADRAAQGMPAGSPTRVLASLARGRALLRLNRDAEARAVFGRVRSVAPEGEAGWRVLANLGYALADGCRADDVRIREALRAVEAWGEKRILSYCLGELRERSQGDLASSPSRIDVASSPEAEALVCGVEAVGGEGSWPERGARALRAVTSQLPWDLAAWLGHESWQVSPCGEDVRPLPSDALASYLAEPGLHDLLASRALRDHPERALLDLAEALTVRVASGTLVVARNASRPTWTASQRGLAYQLARVFGSSEATVWCPPTTGVRMAAGRSSEAIVGECASIVELRATLARVAQSDVTVRVTGETGTGKELVARAVHDLSPRHECEFVPFNSAAVQDELFESELFGHVKGAFTGAVVDRVGRVQLAEGGTLFIDEVAELSPRGQAKLLRFLESGEFVRVGESRVRHADVRIVVATNVDLEQHIALGSFREDLLHRMRDPELRLPPLRERGDDLLGLARHFLIELARESGRPRQRLSASTAQRLRGYTWPGNVRELRQALRSAVALAGPDPLEASHLPKRLRAAPARGTRGLAMSGERELILDALRATNGNCTRAAARLGVTRQWFYRMRKRSGLIAERRL